MQSHFPRKDHKKAKFFTKQTVSLQHQTRKLERRFPFKEKKAKTTQNETKKHITKN